MNSNIKNAQNEVRQNIINLFEIEKLPENKQEETISKIGQIIFQSVLMRILPLLEEDDLAAYDKLIEEKAMPDAVLEFFFDKVPSFLDIVAEESENLRKESAEVLKQINSN
jgi:hypothetical protein